MKKLIIISIMFIVGCAPKYQVVQELQKNMYHLYNAKDGVVVVLTKDSLIINEYYKLSQIEMLNKK